MKTTRSIEEQDERKQARDNGDEARISPELTQPVTQKKRRGDASRIAAWRWQPGKSANPGGVPKHDIARELAKAVFENNPELIYKAFVKALSKGSAYAYQVLADRGYGKLKEHFEVEAGPFRDLSEDELLARIKQLEEQLGVSSAPVTLEDDAAKPN